MLESRTILWGVVVQVTALLLSRMFLDLGQISSATIYLSIVYWAICCIILIRRHQNLTPGDKWFIAFGLIPILVVGVPAFIIVWTMRGAL